MTSCEIIEGVTLHQGDCRDIMDLLGDAAMEGMNAVGCELGERIFP